MLPTYTIIQLFYNISFHSSVVSLFFDNSCADSNINVIKFSLVNRDKIDQSLFTKLPVLGTPKIGKS